MNIKFLLASTVSIVILAGCAGVPSQPQEAPISVQMTGTAVEVQNFIESKMMTYQGGTLRVDSVTDRQITFKTHCVNVQAQMNTRCSLIMMTIGNSYSDGPFLTIGFRTNEVRGVVTLNVSSQWCATNPYGRESCRTASTNKENNDLLRAIKNAYDTK